MNYLFLGDVHGNFDMMEECIEDVLSEYPIDRIVQVGDFGFYPNVDPLPTKDFGVDQWFIRGNHENHDLLLALEGKGPIEIEGTPWKYVPDGYVDENGCIYLGGAYSIDSEFRRVMERQHRYLGIEYPYRWFSNEEISDWTPILEGTDWNKINTIVSHDCPSSMLPLMHAKIFSNKTSNNLERVAEKTVGKINWFFGHHHKTELLKKSSGRITLRCINMFASEDRPYYIEFDVGKVV